MIRVMLVSATVAAIAVGCGGQRREQTGARAAAEAAGDARGADATSEAFGLIEQLLTRSGLYYSSDDDSAATRFHFVTRVTHVSDVGTATTAEFAVQRDEDEVIVVCSTNGGLPYAYMRGGLFVAVDSRRPGGLIVRGGGGGAPTFLLRADEEQHRLNFAASYSAKQVKAYVLLDLPSLLRSTKSKLRHGKIDRDKGLIHVTSENSAITIFMGGDADAVPVRAFLSTSTTGAAVHIAEVSLGRAPWATYLSEKRLLNAGLPVRRAGGGEGHRLDLLVPPDLKTNVGCRRAAEKLQELLIDVPERPKSEQKAKRLRLPAT